MLIAICHSTLPADGAADAPEWLHLLPAGTFKGADGRGPYTLADPAGVIAASLPAGSRLPIDENHSTDLAAPSGQPSPARAWIVELQSRADGIWGRIDWSESGKSLMADKAYRGISPVFNHDKSGRVVKLLRAALTNTPNLGQLATLHSHSGADMDITQLRAALGQPETADEAACLALVRQHAAAVSLHSTQMAAIAAAAGISAATPEAITTALQSQRTSLVPVDQVIALQTQLDTLVANQRREKATAFVDGAIRAGKPINASRDQMIAMHIADSAGAERLVSGLPSINAGGIALNAGNPDAYDGEMMSADDMAVCARMGMDPKKFAAAKKKAREHVTQDGSAA